MAGGQAQAHIAPVLATGLHDQGLALQLHLLLGGVQLGAVAGLPARPAHLVAQAHIGRACAGQLHADFHDLRLLGTRAVALLAQGLQLRQQILLLALNLVGTQAVVAAGLAQDLAGAGNLRGADSGFVTRLAHALQKIAHQPGGAFFGLDVRELILKAANLLIQRAGAFLGSHLPGLHQGLDLTHAHAFIAADLQALRIHAGGQAFKAEQAGLGVDACLALYGGDAGIERDLGDGRAIARDTEAAGVGQDEPGQSSCDIDHGHRQKTA